MFDLIFIGLLVLLALILAIDSINKYRTTKKLLYAIACAFGMLAALFSIQSISSGFYFIVLTVIIRIVASLVKKTN